MSNGRGGTRTGTFYHYTSTTHLPWILQAGKIVVTESNVGAPVGTGMKPAGQNAGPQVVWLFAQPIDFDDGPKHGLDNSAHDKSAVRFTVRTRATRWIDWEPASRMHPAWRAAMIRTGGGNNASKRWWVAENPIHRSKWREIHVRHVDGTWLPLSDIQIG